MDKNTKNILKEERVGEIFEQGLTNYSPQPKSITSFCKLFS